MNLPYFEVFMACHAGLLVLVLLIWHVQFLRISIIKAMLNLIVSMSALVVLFDINVIFFLFLGLFFF